ncbi:hypothetical protein ABTF08_20580, partial [Acinetobacter baumannii]
LKNRKRVRSGHLSKKLAFNPKNRTKRPWQAPDTDEKSFRFGRKKEISERYCFNATNRDVNAATFLERSVLPDLLQQLENRLDR